MATLKLILIFFFMFFIGCKNQIERKAISSAYYGIIEMDAREYHFNIDNTYRRKATGHMEVSETKGTYSIIHDTIIMNPFSREQQADSFFNRNEERFLLVGDSCIVDIQFHYNFCKAEMYNALK